MEALSGNEIELHEVNSDSEGLCVKVVNACS